MSLKVNLASNIKYKTSKYIHVCLVAQPHPRLFLLDQDSVVDTVINSDFI